MHETWTCSVLRDHTSRNESAFAPQLFRSRLRWLLWAFVAGLLTVYGRLIAGQWHDGAEYRAAALQPVRRVRTVAAPRGRILARDGTVLAVDRPEVDLALNYRWLEEPADPRWLRSLARSRLSPRERRNPKRVAGESLAILDERTQLWHRLGQLCGLTDEQWESRRRQIQRKVEAIASSVEARQLGAGSARWTGDSAKRELAESSSVAELVGRSVLDALFAVDDPPANAPVTIAEEKSEHVVFEGLSLEAVAEIESHPLEYPAVQLLHSFRREYPQQPLAAHSIGYLGFAQPAENSPLANWQGRKENSANQQVRVGRSGLERQYETILRGLPGLIVDEIDLGGKIAASDVVRSAEAGGDVVLTLDPSLERTAETLLDSALARRIASGSDVPQENSGGAVLVINVEDGAILAAASAPRFDPNAFVKRDNEEIRRLLADRSRPLFDRTIQMALPPGSTFKVVAAAALLNSGVDPASPVDCEGYLHQPDTLRCAIFRRLGIGHGPVTMTDALARSCNVYFFHYAEQLGPAPLIDWGRRFGLGSPCEIDLPGEVRGSFPPATATANETSAAGDDHSRQDSQVDPRQLAIGQGPITATPLQMARMIAAIANGGRLVRPHFIEQSTGAVGSKNPTASSPASPIPGLSEQTLQVIHKGLRQAVASSEGTAHATVDFDAVAIAGKTGTAQVGGQLPDHSWFAGYAPADDPQVAIVVVLEHAGEASTAAGPVVRRLVERMNELGYFFRGPTQEAAASAQLGQGRRRTRRFR